MTQGQSSKVQIHTASRLIGHEWCNNKEFSFVLHAQSNTTIFYLVVQYEYSDTSANEDNSFRNHIRQPKRDFPYVSIAKRSIRSGCCPLFKDKFYKIVKSTI